jgi:hypothetical protein
MTIVNMKKSLRIVTFREAKPKSDLDRRVYLNLIWVFLFLKVIEKHLFTG